MKRREFLIVMAAGPAVPLAAAEFADPEKLKETIRGDMRYRPLGVPVSKSQPLAWEATTLAARKKKRRASRSSAPAIDHGINFMDNCWDYHDGGSEIRMG